MIREYRCARCRHLLFKGNLQLLVAKQHDPDATYIEPKCPKCGLINRFAYDASQEIRKVNR